MTLKELKDLCKQKKVSFELIEWYGNTGEQIPEKIRGIYDVTSTFLTMVYIRNAHDNAVGIQFLKTLFVIENDILTVYEAGTREPDADEQKLLDDWAAKLEHYKKKHANLDVYWQKTDFFVKAERGYLAGDYTQNGLKYDENTGKIIDESIKGKVILKYRIININ